VNVKVGKRRISVRHEPVLGRDGRVKRVVATAIDVTIAKARANAIPAWLSSLASAS
jgi:hypothetical protein